MTTITVRPVYDRVRSLRGSFRGYMWGIYANGKLTAITPRYPSKIDRAAV